MSAALLASITARFPQLAPTLQHGLVAIDLTAEALPAVATALKNDFAFDLLLDVTAVDWPAGSRGSTWSVTSIRRPTGRACD